jgi:soluble lytic murein transglycosylase-like protein
MRISALAMLVCLVAAVPAKAQIYSWRDASGQLVLSNTPKQGAAPGTTYAVPGTTYIRTTSKPSNSSRANAYDDLIRQHADSHGISADLVRAVIQAESGFNRWAVSPKGAMGLMQLMPATARDLGVRDPFHPDENIRGGVTYLAQLLARFNQDVSLALAAYNAGAERVERYNGVPPYQETRNYVKKITGATKAASAARETVIYKWIELVDGQPKARYSNIPPRDVPYEKMPTR